MHSPRDPVAGSALRPTANAGGRHVCPQADQEADSPPPQPEAQDAQAAVSLADRRRDRGQRTSGRAGRFGPRIVHDDALGAMRLARSAAASPPTASAIHLRVGSLGPRRRAFRARLRHAVAPCRPRQGLARRPRRVIAKRWRNHQVRVLERDAAQTQQIDRLLAENRQQAEHIAGLLEREEEQTGSDRAASAPTTPAAASLRKLDSRQALPQLGEGRSGGFYRSRTRRAPRCRPSLRRSTARTRQARRAPCRLRSPSGRRRADRARTSRRPRSQRPQATEDRHLPAPRASPARNV